MLLTILKKAGSWYERLEELVLVCLVFGMVALGAGQILFRNVISVGLVWIDPLLSHLVLWVALLGASIATRENRHIVIEVLPERLSPAVRSRIKGGLQLFSALVCLFLVYPAVRFIMDDYGPGKYLALGIPLWVSQTVMPVMWLVLGIRFMLQGFKKLIRGNTNSHSSGRPSLRPGTPGGSEEPHPQAGTRAHSEYAEESDSVASCKDAATTKVYT